MRTKDFLFSLNEITTLLQYLYMDAEHYICVKNSFTTLKIHMTDQLQFLAENLSFPNCPAMDYTAEMTVPVMLSVIEKLKIQPAKEFPNAFTSRWEEIKNITEANVSLNHFNRR